jgi:hypothetical protein
MYTDETVLVLNNPTLAHLQAVYYNSVKFHLNPMSRLGGVALTSPSLHTERISEYKLNYLLFQILDSDHISSYTSAGSGRPCGDP